MAHYDVMLPSGVTFDFAGGPAFDTEVVRNQSGHEKRNQIRPFPLGEYEVSWPARLQSKYEELLAFFRVIAKGRANTFLIKDPFNNEATQAQGVLTLTDDSPQITYQAIKRWSYAGQTADQTIQKLRAGTISVYDNGVAMVSGYTVNANDGTIDITSGTGPYTWAGEFRTVVRFDTDPMKSIIVTKGRGEQYLIEWRSIPLIEVLL